MSDFPLLEVWGQPQRAVSGGARKVLLLYPAKTHGEGLSEEEEEGGDSSVKLPGRSSSLGSMAQRDQSEWKVCF
ncbi:hypothetical protein SESBI_26009 [Sesbania bispinosa]|nr:hypothetical protein SESBI_26009 [Sesbania bispinosa]